MGCLISDMKRDTARIKKIRNTINNAISDRWYRLGMTADEIAILLKKLGCPKNLFWKMFGVNTCIGSMCKKCKHSETIFYTCDIEQALAKIYKYRTVHYSEWD